MGGVVAGVLCQLQQPVLWPAWVYACLAFAGVAGWAAACWRPHWRCLQRLLPCAMAAVLAFAWTGGRAAIFQAQAMPAQWQGKDVQVTGVIASLPQSGEHGLRMRFRIEQAHAAVAPHAAVQLPPLVQLAWYGEPPPEGLSVGQRWTWTVRLKAPHGERNPHGMDWELWMWSQSIQATGYVRTHRSVSSPALLDTTWHYPIAQWRGRWLAAMQVDAQHSARHQASWGVVQALVTGAQSRIGREDWQLFRDTGTAHLVSISGLHITMFAWLAMAVVRRAWRWMPPCCHRWPAPTAAAWIGLALATVYALFSGWGIPAQRTIGMLALVVLLQSWARRWPWPYVWMVVLTAVVIADPWAILQPGFWLSFVAVGVLFASQPHSLFLRSGRARGYVHKTLREQWVITVALAPLSLMFFGQISVVGMLANLVAIPWMTLVVTPLAMLGVLWPLLWEAAAWTMTGLIVVLQHLAAWPMAVMYFAQPPWWVALVGLCAGLWWVLPLPWRWRWPALPALLPLLAWQPAVPPLGHFELMALDVGQGSAVLLRTQQHSLLFDAGPQWSANSDAGERIVVPTLRALGVDLRAMMISHADRDHAGGAQAVAHAFPRVQRWGTGGQACRAGDSWVWDGVRFDVVHPLTTHAAPPKNHNASSCVLRVQSQSGMAALLPGDIEAAQEQALLAAATHLKAQLVLMPHHGSQTSSSWAWLQAVAPQIAIAQAGYLHRFGHPHPQVLQRYAQLGVQTFVTATCGAATWQSWHPAHVKCERATPRKYWQQLPPA